MSSRHVDALVWTQHTVILYLCNDLRAVDADNEHIQRTIVKQHVVAFLHISSEVLIGEIQDVVGRVNLRTSHELHHIACLVFDRCLTARSTNLGAFGVDENTDVRTYRAHVPYYIFNTLFRSMGGVHSDDIHTGVEELSNKVSVTTTVTDGSHNLGLFHNKID